MLPREADAVILYLGTTLDVEAEGLDRTDLGLPAGQEALIEEYWLPTHAP